MTRNPLTGERWHWMDGAVATGAAVFTAAGQPDAAAALLIGYIVVDCMLATRRRRRGR